MRRALVAAALALVAAAAPARAAYDPQLSVSVDPPAPATAASLTATLTQASGERATQSERVRFPPRFGFNPGLRVARCAPDQERAAACPPDSRIGNASAQTMFGEFAGPVFLTGDFRFVVFLRGLAGLVEQEVSGYVVLDPDGSTESVLENLPDVPSTLSRVTFDSGPRSLFLTPRACGRYVLDARFTSHAGEQVTRHVPIDIKGCDTAPRFVATDARRARVAWQLSEPAATVVDVYRLVPDGRFVRRRRVLHAQTSATRLALRLRRGRYEVVLTALSAAGHPSDVRHLFVR